MHFLVVSLLLVEVTPLELAPSPYYLIISICLVYMNVYSKFDEIQSLALQDIKETKHYGRTDTRMHGQTMSKQS